MKKEFVFALAVCALGALVPGAARADDTYYVDAAYTGTETGSSSQPFKELDDALDEVEDGDTIELVAGTYEGNFEIPEGVSVEGADRDSVIIKAEDDDDPTVIMNNDTQLRGVTVKNGDNGIKVEASAKVEIEDCIVSGNENDGIFILSSAIDDDYQVTIKDSTISDNNGRGIYSESRQLKISDNLIYSNDKDGIYLEAGVEGDIKENEITNNKRHGINAMLDEADLTVYHNALSRNTKSGLYVYTQGEEGEISVKRNTFRKNKRYAVEKYYDGKGSFDWDGVKIKKDNRYISNKKGKTTEKSK
jgi:parallel beta-helix repeat protein